MDDQTNQYQEAPKKTLGIYIIVGILGSVCLILIITIFFILQHKQEVPKPTPQTATSDVTPAPAKQYATGIVSQINPNTKGVTSALSFYTLSGRISTLNKTGNNYVISLTDSTGGTIITDLVVKEAELGRLGEFESNSAPLTPILITSLKEGDHVDVGINDDLKRHVYQVASLVRYHE